MKTDTILEPANSITFDKAGNATVIGAKAHNLYCSTFHFAGVPRQKSGQNRFFVFEMHEPPQGARFELIAAQSTRINALKYAQGADCILIEVPDDSAPTIETDTWFVVQNGSQVDIHRKAEGREITVAADLREDDARRIVKDHNSIKLLIPAAAAAFELIGDMGCTQNSPNRVVWAQLDEAIRAANE